MKLTVLNSGSSGNGYILEGRRSALLIECGVRPEELFRMTDFPASKIEAALISHEHGDHAKYAHRYASMGIPICASAGTFSKLPQFHKSAVLHKLHALQVYIGGDFTISTFDTMHDAAEPLGFIIEHEECGRILFMTDTAACKYNFRDMALDHIMVEANYDDGMLTDNAISGAVDVARAERTRRTHFSIRQACEFIQSVETPNLKNIILIHLSIDNADAAVFARKAEETALLARVHVATKGFAIDLKKREI